MMQGDSCIDKEILRKQQNHWEKIFLNNNAKFGEKPSLPAQWTAETFRKKGKTNILELGARQGRDTLFLAVNGFEVCSLDYSKNGIHVIRQKARIV